MIALPILSGVTENMRTEDFLELLFTKNTLDRNALTLVNSYGFDECILTNASDILELPN